MTKADRVREADRVAKISGARRKGNLYASKLGDSLPLSTRDNRILAQRLAFALRHPVTPDAVLIDIKAAELLLHRLAPVDELRPKSRHSPAH